MPHASYMRTEDDNKLVTGSAATSAAFQRELDEQEEQKMSRTTTNVIITVVVVVFLALTYRRARGELTAWQGWGTALTCGWLISATQFLPDVVRQIVRPFSAVISASNPLAELAAFGASDPLVAVAPFGALFLWGALYGLGAALCSILLADMLVSILEVTPAPSSELAQEVQALRKQGLDAQNIKRRVRYKFFVAGATLNTLTTVQREI